MFQWLNLRQFTRWTRLRLSRRIRRAILWNYNQRMLHTVRSVFWKVNLYLKFKNLFANIKKYFVNIGRPIKRKYCFNSNRMAFLSSANRFPIRSIVEIRKRARRLSVRFLSFLYSLSSPAYRVKEEWRSLCGKEKKEIHTQEVWSGIVHEHAHFLVLKLPY